MSHPPQGPGPNQPWQGGPQTNPSLPGQPGAPAGPGHPPQGPGFPQQPGAGPFQQGPGYGPPGASGYGGAPRKSNKGLWIALASVLAIALIVGILFLMGVFGGGKYAGDKVPELPEKFGSWSKQQQDDSGGLTLGDQYSNGSDKVYAFRVMGEDPEKKIEEQREASTKGMDVDVKERDLGGGVRCYDSSFEGQTGTTCAVLYKDGLVAFRSEAGSTAEKAAKEFKDKAK